MKLFKKIFVKRRIILLIDIILLIVSINCYRYIYVTEQVKSVFVGEAVRFAEENSNPIFKINKITYIGLTETFVIHGNVICSSPDLKIGTKTVSYYVDQQYYIQPKGEININCLDDLIVNDTEEIKKLVNSELNYMRLVSSHFYE